MLSTSLNIFYAILSTLVVVRFFGIVQKLIDYFMPRNADAKQVVKEIQEVTVDVSNANQATKEFAKENARQFEKLLQNTVKENEHLDNAITTLTTQNEQLANIINTTKNEEELYKTTIQEARKLRAEVQQENADTEKFAQHYEQLISQNPSLSTLSLKY